MINCVEEIITVPTTLKFAGIWTPTYTMGNIIVASKSSLTKFKLYWDIMQRNYEHYCYFKRFRFIIRNTSFES